ncbi:alkaline phosphatase family protein [Ferviditalea candida]|uniref:Alkaline phosphatase family protein n=1 Tax=Ferviditalea candida TaxID=3108399 RepID=A0ABU5ZCX1_9BACL|nr:alkaline phosphatase family protein [Paenibacillaceae bacterium T2]
MNFRRMTAVFASLVLILSPGCRKESQQPSHLSSETPLALNNSKRVILLIIDSLMDQPLREAIGLNRAPALQFLMSHGSYFPNVVSSFPTMSVTIDSTLLTGTYADIHHVPGLVWYHENEKRMVNYGNGLKDIIKQGPVQVLLDTLHELNNTHLNPEIPTIHEELADKGKTSASINVFVYRGRTGHSLRIPESIAHAGSLPKSIKTYGPEWLSFGAASQLNPSNQSNTFVWRGYGINDAFSSQELVYLIRNRLLPDLSIVYFPDNDLSVHEKGSKVQEGIEKADEQLRTILDAFGSWENALKNTIWIVIGDSGQTEIGKDRRRSIIRLNELLSQYRMPQKGKAAGAQDRIVFGINERMAYIYILDRQLPLPELVHRLQQDDRINVIAWKQKQSILVKTGKNHQTLSYRPAGKYKDEYGQSWSMEGDPGILDIRAIGHRIHYGAYPDALARLYGALHSHKGNFLVIDAKPGYEFADESSPVHPGGAGHGSLHKEDSLIPMMIVGTPSNPDHLRIKDLKKWLLKILKK